MLFQKTKVYIDRERPYGGTQNQHAACCLAGLHDRADPIHGDGNLVFSFRADHRARALPPDLRA